MASSVQKGPNITVTPKFLLFVATIDSLREPLNCPITGLVVLTIEMEEKLQMLKPQQVPPCRILWSPYRDALTRYLSKFSTEAVAYFLTPLRLTNDAYFTRLLDMMQHPLGALLLEQMAASGDQLANLLRPPHSATASAPPPAQLLLAGAAQGDQPSLGGDPAVVAGSSTAAAGGAADETAAPIAGAAAQPMESSVVLAGSGSAAGGSESAAGGDVATATPAVLDPMDISVGPEAGASVAVVQSLPFLEGAAAQAVGMLTGTPGSTDPAAGAAAADPMDHTSPAVPALHATAPGQLT